MRTVYDVVGQYQAPGAEPDRVPAQRVVATFDTLDAAQDYLRGLGYLWDLRGWQKGRWIATIHETRETEEQYQFRQESKRREEVTP